MGKKPPAQSLEALYRVLFEQATDGIFIADEQGAFVEVNRRGCEMLGYRREEMLGLSFRELIPAEELANDPLGLEELRAGETRLKERRLRRKDGRLLPVEISSRVMEDGRFLGIVRDISKRKKIETALRESQALLAQAEEIGQSGIFDWNLQTNTAIWSPGMHRLFEIPPEAFNGDPSAVLRVVHPDDRDDMAEALQDVINERKVRSHLEYRLLPPSGDIRYIWAQGFLVLDEDENVSRMIGVCYDITDRKEAELERERLLVQIQEQERLAAVGQLAAGIAHDFNNILAVITLYAQLISHTVELPGPAQEKIRTIEQQTARATELIQQILDFSRQSVLEKRPLDLQSFMEEMVNLLNRTLPEHVQIELEHGAERYVIKADFSRMQQVLMNLALNARDAMPEGGYLTIKLDRVRVEEKRPMLMQDLPPGDWIQIAVSDSGVGIPQESLTNIFEPFFTTKEVGQGVGLGLAQVYGIVQQHEGYVDVSTTVGEGTTLFLYFPAIGLDGDSGTLDDGSSLKFGQGQMVLVVEDDPVTREALLDSLDLLNYAVVAAGNGREALEILAKGADDIDVVLSDIVMPDMGGIDLFQAMLDQGLTIPVVLLTGHPLSKELENLQALGLVGWLSKPPSLANLSFLLAKGLGT